MIKPSLAGLEYLAMVDHLLIKQQVELLEAFTGWESCNKYRIFNSMGQDVFYAKEDNDCCTRMCCGPGRPFEMEIVDNLGREVIHLGRCSDRARILLDLWAEHKQLDVNC